MGLILKLTPDGQCATCVERAGRPTRTEVEEAFIFHIPHLAVIHSTTIDGIRARIKAGTIPQGTKPTVISPSGRKIVGKEWQWSPDLYWRWAFNMEEAELTTPPPYTGPKLWRPCTCGGMKEMAA